MSLDRDNLAKENPELTQETLPTESTKYSTIKKKFIELKSKHEGDELSMSKKISFPERESDEFQNCSISGSINNSLSNLNLSESVLKIKDKFFNSKDSILSEDLGKHKELYLKDYEVSAFPEENEEEYSDENNNNNNDINLYTNINQFKINFPKLNEGEFILIEQETKPTIDKYEKYYITSQESGDVIITQTKIRHKNEESFDLSKEKKGQDKQLNTSSRLKEIYYEYDKNNKDEQDIKDFIKKKWKYFVKLFIIEKNRKADEYRRFILQALMKYQYQKNSNKKIITKEKYLIDNNINKNKLTNINIIKNEPKINLINEDEIMSDINIYRKQKKIGIDKEEIKTKKLKFNRTDEPQEKNINTNTNIKNKLFNLLNKYEDNNNKEKEEYEEYYEEEEEEDDDINDNNKENKVEVEDKNGKKIIKKKIIIKKNKGNFNDYNCNDNDNDNDKNNKNVNNKITKKKIIKIIKRKFNDNNAKEEEEERK